LNSLTLDIDIDDSVAVNDVSYMPIGNYDSLPASFYALTHSATGSSVTGSDVIASSQSEKSSNHPTFGGKNLGVLQQELVRSFPDRYLNETFVTPEELDRHTAAENCDDNVSMLDCSQKSNCYVVDSNCLSCFPGELIFISLCSLSVTSYSFSISLKIMCIVDF
jgi:hypothetical protein